MRKRAIESDKSSITPTLSQARTHARTYRRAGKHLVPVQWGELPPSNRQLSCPRRCDDVHDFAKSGWWKEEKSNNEYETSSSIQSILLLSCSFRQQNNSNDEDNYGLSGSVCSLFKTSISDRGEPKRIESKQKTSCCDNSSESAPAEAICATGHDPKTILYHCKKDSFPNSYRVGSNLSIESNLPSKNRLSTQSKSWVLMYVWK